LSPKKIQKRPAAAPMREQVTLEFPNNALLSGLAGTHQKHFVRLEQKFGVRLATRGNLVGIEGPDDARGRAATVLRALYARLEGGEDVHMGDVDAEILFATEDRAPAIDTTDFGVPAVKTSTAKTTRARNPAQAAYLDLMRTHPLVFGIGPAGTGKTYLAAAFAAHLLHTRRVERLILCRPALEAGERLGFLPGTLEEKVDPYLRPLRDALFDVLGPQFDKLLETGVIEFAPLAFMRGRTLARAFIILDEAQNATSPQMKMFLTRLGEDSRMVVTGDTSQSDLPGGRAEGLNQALSLLSDTEGVAVARFSEKDVVRHALVTRIVTAYAAAEAAETRLPSRYTKADE
jgi:phosphate starvation-inducible PhoH-like protein